MIFSLIGYGRFGKLWAESLLQFGKVMVYDKATISQKDSPGIAVVSLKEAAQADVIFIVTPISQFENACLELQKQNNTNSLIMDCCSVKIYPVSVMQKHFSEPQELIATHPLFGPDSVKKKGGISGHKIVVCPIRCETKLDFILMLFKKMGLNIVMTTPQEHDKQMASSQGLVHFIGRGLATLDMQEQELATPDFQALLNINHMVINDTRQLFLDMHQYNPYTKAIRTKLINELIKIDNEVENEIKN